MDFDNDNGSEDVDFDNNDGSEDVDFDPIVLGSNGLTDRMMLVPLVVMEPFYYKMFGSDIVTIHSYQMVSIKYIFYFPDFHPPMLIDTVVIR